MLSSHQLLLLTQIKGVGKSAINGVIEYLSQRSLQFSAAAADIVDLLEQVRQTNKRIKVPDIADVHAAIDFTSKIEDHSDAKGIKIIGCFDSIYPQRYLDLKDKPLLVHCKGSLEALDLPTVAIIGTREPSAHAIKLGPRLCAHFAKAGLSIVSGLAIGCDTIAHQAALDNNSPTVAVMAGGLQSVYPKENEKLAAEILDHGGLWLSELPVGQHPQRSTFVDRDRLQSGLSYAVVVIETGIKGGTLHTVGFAAEQHRMVACMYSHYNEQFETHDKFQGNKMLVESGKALKLDSLPSIESLIASIKKQYAERNPADKSNTPIETPHHDSGQLSLFK